MSLIRQHGLPRYAFHEQAAFACCRLWSSCKADFSPPWSTEVDPTKTGACKHPVQGQSAVSSRIRGARNDKFVKGITPRSGSPAPAPTCFLEFNSPVPACVPGWTIFVDGIPATEPASLSCPPENAKKKWSPQRVHFDCQPQKSGFCV